MSCDSHIQGIVTKANKLLGLLKKTCPLLQGTEVRRTLYLSIVKSKLSYATEVWFPIHTKVKTKIEIIQRRATNWIRKSKPGVTSYKSNQILFHTILFILTSLITLLKINLHLNTNNDKWTKFIWASIWLSK